MNDKSAGSQRQALSRTVDTGIVQQELFKQLFDSAPDPIVIVDDKGCIYLANAEASRKFGYEQSQLLNQPLEILLPERFRKSHISYRQNYNEAPRLRAMGTGIDLFVRHRDGHEIPVEISLSPLRVEGALLVISIIRDISERKAKDAELKEKAEELLRSNKELEQFAYVASHDLQEPLRSIAGACQLLRKRYGDKFDAAGLEFLDYSVDGAKRMQELITDLLAYSRVTTKASDPVPTDFNKVIAQVVTGLRGAIEETEATITHTDLPTLPADFSQIVQLFQNLIGNSLKFRGDRQPCVSITAEKKSTATGAEWEFAVADNGIGIASKYFERIFVIFRRLHTRDEYPGTGIGLATCKRIVERHGGRIWVESTPGVGTTFRFTLPAGISGM